jgi:hypothetical protein
MQNYAIEYSTSINSKISTEPKDVLKRYNTYMTEIGCKWNNTGKFWYFSNKITDKVVETLDKIKSGELPPVNNRKLGENNIKIILPALEVGHDWILKDSNKNLILLTITDIQQDTNLRIARYADAQDNQGNTYRIYMNDFQWQIQDKHDPHTLTKSD